MNHPDLHNSINNNRPEFWPFRANVDLRAELIRFARSASRVVYPEDRLIRPAISDYDVVLSGKRQYPIGDEHLALFAAHALSFANRDELAQGAFQAADASATLLDGDGYHHLRRHLGASSLR
jgi:hypothetical protein